MLSPGTQLANKYQVLSVIGEGGFGKVYLGYDVGMDRHVAIKELLRDAENVSTEDWRDYQLRFKKEAQIVSRFSHTNVVGAYALETDDEGNLYLVLEYVDGGSLKQLLEEGSPLAVERAIDIAIDICGAIEAIYKRDIVHRDIKPSNILLTRDGVAKLTDFGVAQVGHETRRTQEALGHPGTPAYKSPEQATSTGYLDERSDLYALGLVLYEMLTGNLYVRNRFSPRHYNPQVPQSLNAVVMKALEEDPAERYQSAAEMRRDLEHVRDQVTWGQAQILFRTVSANRFALITGLVGVFFILAGLYRMAGALVGAAGATTPTAPAVVTPLVPATATLVVPMTPTPTATSTPEPTPTPQGFVDIYEPDDEAPAPIAIGEVQQRSFDPQDDIDRVTFRVRAGMTYLVSAMNLSAGVDTRMEVLVGGEQLENDDAQQGTMASQVTVLAVEDGMAVVTVYNQDQYGPERRYDLSVVAVLPTVTPEPSLTQPLSPTVTTAMTPLATSTPRPTLTPGPTSTPIRSITPTRTRTNTPTITRTRTITRTPTRTLTRTPTRTRTPTISVTPSRTPGPSLTPTLTVTPTLNRTPLPVRTEGPPSR